MFRSTKGSSRGAVAASSKAARVASAFAVTDTTEEIEGDAWGVGGDVLLDEDGNPEIDGNEELNGAVEDGEGGWDVSCNIGILTAARMQTIKLSYVLD